MNCDRLKQIRVLRGLSQRDLADRCNIHVNQIQRYESGDADATDRNLTRLCRELYVSADYLLGLVDQPGDHTGAPLDIDPLALKIDAALKSADPGQLGRVTTELVNTAWRLAGASKVVVQAVR